MNPTLARTSLRGLVTLVGTGLLLVLAAGPAAAEPDRCISTNGTVRHQSGTATCSSVDGRGNVAIARGDGADATAGLADGDDHNRATASGDNSQAVTGFGDGNTATASGDSSIAGAGAGDDNTVTAETDGCATVAVGDGSTASC